jgi:hypothetical protein
MRIKPNLRKVVAAKTVEVKPPKEKPTKAKQPPPNPPKRKHICGHGPNLGIPCMDCMLKKGREHRRKKFQQIAAHVPGRLPDKSRFVMEYNAEDENWYGSLTIDGSVYEDRSWSVHHLLRMLGGPHLQSQVHTNEKGANNGEAKEASGTASEASGEQDEQGAQGSRLGKEVSEGGSRSLGAATGGVG